MVFTSSRRKHGWKVFYKSKNRIYTTVTSHVNISDSTDMNTYNRDNVIVNSNIPCINVHTERSSNEIVTLHKETDTESSTSINEENMDDNTASEEIASHQNSTGVIDHTCDDNIIIYSIQNKKFMLPLFNKLFELMTYL